MGEKQYLVPVDVKDVYTAAELSVVMANHPGIPLHQTARRLMKVRGVIVE